MYVELKQVRGFESLHYVACTDSSLCAKICTSVLLCLYNVYVSDACYCLLIL